MKQRRPAHKKPILSAGVVPVYQTSSENLVLLLRVYNYWDFPKGVVEVGENPLAAAQREFFEETALTDIEFKWGHGYIETPPYSYGKVARYYVGRVHSLNVLLQPNPLTHLTEHHEYRWLSFDHARHLLVPRVRTALNWANEKVSTMSEFSTLSL